MRQWIGKGKGTFEEDGTKRMGRKVWREKNLLLLLGMLDGRMDRYGLMALIK